MPTLLRQLFKGTEFITVEMSESMMRLHISRRETIRFAKGYQIFLMLLPMLILFFAFCAYPLLDAIHLGFTKYNGFTEPTYIGLANYTRLLSDKSWWNAVLNTFQFTLMAYVVQIPLSLLLAVLLNTGIRGQNLFRAVLFLPNVTSTAIMGIIFFFMFSSFNGIVNGLLQQLGILSAPYEWLGKSSSAKWIIILLNTWTQVGYLMILFLSAIQKIPEDLYESADLDGASARGKFFAITLPMLGEMFPVISMMCILNGFQLFDSIKVLTGGGPGRQTTVMAVYIYEYFFNSTGAQQGYASAVSVCATLITALTGMIYYLLTSRKFKNT